jgi:hypothetical protein
MVKCVWRLPVPPPLHHHINIFLISRENKCQAFVIIIIALRQVFIFSEQYSSSVYNTQQEYFNTQHVWFQKKKRFKK